MTTTPRPKRRRRWYQYGLRTLLLLTTFTALVLSGVVWWQSSREQRALQRIIRESDFLSEEEKDLLRSLVWQREARELLEHLGIYRYFQVEYPTPFQWEPDYTLTWNDNYLDPKNRPRRVFYLRFSSFMDGGTIILTDSNHRLIQWKVVDVGGDLESAAVKPSAEAIELSIIADSLGTQPFFRRGTYRFLLDDNGIIEHGVEWDVAFDRSSRQQMTEQLIADQRLPTRADEVSHGDPKRKTSTP